MKTGFLVTARLKSTRLPQKVVLKIEGREVIAWMIDRLKQCQLLDEIVIATSINPQDDKLREIAEREHVSCFRGSESDVLERLSAAAREYNLEYIVNITADCPLVAFDFIENVVEEYKKTDADLITTYNLPTGFYVYGIKIPALEKVLEIKKDADTEVWGGYFTDTGLFNVIDLEIPAEFQRKNYRLTLDYPDDYEFFKALFRGLGKETYKKSSKEIIEFLDKHPEIVEINEHCQEIYQKNLERQKKVILK